MLKLVLPTIAKFVSSRYERFNRIQSYASSNSFQYCAIFLSANVSRRYEKCIQTVSQPLQTSGPITTISSQVVVFEFLSFPLRHNLCLAQYRRLEHLYESVNFNIRHAHMERSTELSPGEKIKTLLPQDLVLVHPW